MEVYTNPHGDRVSTEDCPIVTTGVPLACHKCGTEFDAGDGGRWTPMGHKKWSEFKCPDCDSRVARKKGTNRAFHEDMVDLTTERAFTERCKADGESPYEYELVPGGEVEAEEIGDDILGVFEYYPQNGTTNWLSIDSSDVVTDDEDVPGNLLAHDAFDAAVEWYDSHYKPIGYGDAFGEPKTVDDLDRGLSDQSVLRFVRHR